MNVAVFDSFFLDKNLVFTNHIKIKVILEFFYFAGILYFLTKVEKVKFIIEIYKFRYLLFLIFGLFFISIIHFKSFDLFYWLHFYGRNSLSSFFIFFFFFLIFQNKNFSLDKFFSITLKICSFITLIQLILFFFFSFFSYDSRFVGSFQDPTSAGYVYGLFDFVLISVFLVSKGKILNAGMIFQIFVFFFAFLLSGTFSAMACFFLASVILFYYFVLLNKLNLNLIFILFFCLILLLILGYSIGLFDELIRRVIFVIIDYFSKESRPASWNYSNTSSSIEARIIQLKNLCEFLKNTPFWKLFIGGSSRGIFVTTDSTTLNFIYNFGILGFLFFLLIISSILLRLRDFLWNFEGYNKFSFNKDFNVSIAFICAIKSFLLSILFLGQFLSPIFFLNPLSHIILILSAAALKDAVIYGTNMSNKKLK